MFISISFVFIVPVPWNAVPSIHMLPDSLGSQFMFVEHIENESDFSIPKRVFIRKAFSYYFMLYFFPLSFRLLAGSNLYFIRDRIWIFCYSFTCSGLIRALSPTHQYLVVNP